MRGKQLFEIGLAVFAIMLGWNFSGDVVAMISRRTTTTSGS